MEVPCAGTIAMKEDSVDQILALKTWAIVGLSNNEERPAFGVARLLQSKGHRIVPVHPKGEPVHGEVGYTSLKEIPFPIDVVDCFVNSKLVGEVIDEAISIGAKAVWLQLDVIDQPGIARAEAAGLLAVMNKCPAIEYGKRGS
jgi:predicted CoA-binding protein